MTGLDRVLLAADLMEPSALGEAHGHLMKECPWYQAIDKGGNPGDPAEHCKAGARTVKLTPRTAEASTVPEPVGKPGGPGLWHVRGMQLPPYVQHLAHHLIGKYGESRGIAMAKGIVAKWKAGIAPGGKKGGKPRHTHPDVRAAATKAIAQWEEERGEAHAQSRERGHVKASAAPAFPGKAQIPQPPVPGAKIARAMYTAHRLNDSLFHLSHAAQRLGQARQGKALRRYHMIHVNNHLSHSLDDIHNLVTSVKKNYLPEARELEALTKTMGLSKSVSTDAKVATFAHLIQTLLYHLAHAKRHAALMLAPGPDAVWRFNYDHAHAHLAGALEHCYKLARHVEDNYPDEAKWLGELAKAEDPHDPFTGLTVALAQPAATAPGAAPVLPPGARQQLAVSPQRLKPPEVKLPSPAEVTSLAKQVPECSDAALSRQVRTFLETASVKLAKDDTLGALAMLRSAQTGIYACHKADLGAAGPAAVTANVFRVPAAEQSSANAAMLRSKDKEMAWRKLEQQVAVAIDKIRRRHFHGMYPAGMQQARFTGQDGSESPLARVVRLSGGHGR